MRGVGIILVVWGHCGAPGKNFVYLFHMAIFFICSGYLWDDKNASTLESCWKYFVRKVKTLWIPFAIGNGLFNLCHNLFLRIGIYTDNVNFLNLNIGINDTLKSYMSVKETAIAILKNILFAGGSQLGSATWFLKTLFLISIGNLIIRYLYIHLKKLGRAVFIVCIIGSVVLAQFFSVTGIELPQGIHTCFAAYIAFVIGMLLKKYRVMERCCRKIYVLGICSLVILACMNFVGSIEMGDAYITNIVFFVIVSISGWMLMYCLACLIRMFKLGGVLAYVGQHTLWILILHFLCFKEASYIYILVTGINRLYLAAFPYIQGANGLWIAYVLVGVILPLLIEYLLKNGINSLKGIIHLD